MHLPINRSTTRILLVWLLLAAACTSGTDTTSDPGTSASSSDQPTTTPATTSASTSTPTTTEATEASEIEPEDALATVEEYFEAYAAGEHDRMMSQLSEDVEVSFCFDIGCADRGRRFDRAGHRDLEIHNLAEGTERRALECDVEDDSGATVAVTCTYEEHVSHTLAVDGDGVPIKLTADVSQAGIERFHREIGPPDYGMIGTPFEGWLSRHLPDADPIGCCTWASAEEARTMGEAAQRYAIAWATYLDATGCEDPDYDCGQIQDPTATIEGFFAAYNSGNVDTMMAFLNDASVMTNHPFASVVEDRAQFRSVLESDRAAAQIEDPYSIANLQADGDTVTWDHVWINAAGERWCAEGHEAVVRGSFILSWEFAPDPMPCPDSES